MTFSSQHTTYIIVDRLHGLSNNYFPLHWISFNSFISVLRLGWELEAIMNYRKSWVKKNEQFLK